MITPFRPSQFAHIDEQLPNVDRPTGVAPRRVEYMASVEYDNSKAAFMKVYDKTQRNYKVLPGGACYYDNGLVNTTNPNTSGFTKEVKNSLDFVGQDYRKNIR